MKKSNLFILFLSIVIIMCLLIAILIVTITNDGIDKMCDDILNKPLIENIDLDELRILGEKVKEPTTFYVSAQFYADSIAINGDFKKLYNITYKDFYHKMYLRYPERYIGYEPID